MPDIPDISDIPDVPDIIDILGESIERCDLLASSEVFGQEALLQRDIHSHSTSALSLVSSLVHPEGHRKHSHSHMTIPLLLNHGPPNLTNNR